MSRFEEVNNLRNQLADANNKIASLTDKFLACAFIGNGTSVIGDKYLQDLKDQLAAKDAEIERLKNEIKGVNKEMADVKALLLKTNDCLGDAAREIERLKKAMVYIKSKAEKHDDEDILSIIKDANP
jgi:chromosome segregation ATPase